MLEWFIIFSVATLGAVAFAILFKAGPAYDSADLESEKLRHDLAKLSKEEQKKKAEKEKDKKQKLKEEEKKKEKKEKNRSPPKQRKQETIQEVAEEEEDVKAVKAIYVPSVPIHNNTPTTKVTKDNRSRSPVFEDKPAKREPVNMPTKRQIERDLSQGFVVVQKKGPPPLTPEQRKERELLRQKEEEEERRRESEALTREKERERKRAEASIATEVSLEDVKAKLSKQKQEKQTKAEERRRVNCVVKVYNTSAPDAEETERRSWGITAVPDGDDLPPVDADDYPLLQTND